MRTGGLILMLCWVIPLLGYTQQKQLINIKGSVKEEKTRKPIEGAEIKILGKRWVTTNAFGDFTIEAVIGDELMITHDSFRTITYTIKDTQKIDVLVKENPEEFEVTPLSKKNSEITYSQSFDAAKKNLKKDAAKSIDYVRKALETIREDDRSAAKKKAELYETLGDIYDYWKQADFAEENYQNSLNNSFSKDVKIKLGYAQLANSNYNNALVTFNELYPKRLSTAQRIKVDEGIGDAHKGLSDENNAVTYYNRALSLAQKKRLDKIVITLNSKLADVLQVQGNLNEAEDYIDNSVQLAGRKNKRTSAKQRAKAADFYNTNRSFDKEIQLRKEALEDIEIIEETAAAAAPMPLKSDSIASKVDSRDDRAITSQVQNYKIANAFVAQEAYDEALPYLKESIKKAASVNDLVVQKDATRKLGEVYREKGELKKASDAFEEYGAIVDKLHLQKDQEISQAERFRKELISRANRITTLEKDRELNESRYKLALASQELTNQQSVKQRIIIYSLIGLTILLLLAGYLMYRNMRQQQYANNLLALKSLRSQMNPHFIFNALNSVNTFIATSDERAANKYLTDFSLLMRSVLENSEEDFIPLEKEIELLELYVQLEHFRFQDKFEYVIEVDPKIDSKAYMIPPMLLQPYVENAVWHGLRYKEDKGLLTINFIKKDTDTIEIVISDNGIGRDKSETLKTLNQKKQKSQGMSNIKKRINILNKMYKDEVDVFITDLTQQGGTRVQLILKKMPKYGLK